MKKPTSTIRDMHVIVDLGEQRRATAVAADLAARLDAHLTGVSLALEPLIPVYTMAAPVPTDFIVEAREAALAEARAAGEAFEKVAESAGVTFESITLESIAGEGFGATIRQLRLTDLAVVGQESPDQPEPMRRSVIESILFDAVAPTLVVPYAGVDTLKTARALVAWDGGSQSARAVRAAMPLLQTSEQVQVVIVEESEKWDPDDIPGTDIATHLARHGLDVTVDRIDNPTGNVASTILNYAASSGADWLVMGAYGRSRLREFLLGGTTRDILGSMTLPVLMAH